MTHNLRSTLILIKRVQLLHNSLNIVLSESFFKPHQSGVVLLELLLEVMQLLRKHTVVHEALLLDFFIISEHVLWHSRWKQGLGLLFHFLGIEALF